jgi:hypothetical protein
MSDKTQIHAERDILHRTALNTINAENEETGHEKTKLLKIRAMAPIADLI